MSIKTNFRSKLYRYRFWIDRHKVCDFYLKILLSLQTSCWKQTYNTLSHRVMHASAFGNILIKYHEQKPVTLTGLNVIQARLTVWRHNPPAPPFVVAPFITIKTTLVCWQLICLLINRFGMYLTYKWHLLATRVLKLLFVCHSIVIMRKLEEAQ